MKDPIIAEIHAHREAFAKRFNYDIAAMTKYLSEKYADNPKVVDLSEQAAEKHQHVAEEPGKYGGDKIHESRTGNDS